jgi:hypothetical protein
MHMPCPRYWHTHAEHTNVACHMRWHMNVPRDAASSPYHMGSNTRYYLPFDHGGQGACMR